MEGHICRQNTLTFALVFCFELRARAARTCCHCHLAVKNPIHDGNQSVKGAKKSRTVPQCGHVTLNCVQMASKQAKVKFSSHIFQFTRLHSVAVISDSHSPLAFVKSRTYVHPKLLSMKKTHQECLISFPIICQVSCYSNIKFLFFRWWCQHDCPHAQGPVSLRLKMS